MVLDQFLHEPIKVTQSLWYFSFSEGLQDMGFRSEANINKQLFQPPLDSRLLGTKLFHTSNLAAALRGGQGKIY